MRNVAVVGAGPVGSILAAHLVHGGCEVHLVDVQRRLLHAAAAEGLRITGVTELHVRIDHVWDGIEALRGIDLDEIYVCTKAGSLLSVAHELGTLGREGVNVVSFQNGIDNERVLAGFFPPANVFRGVVNYAGMMLQPGVVSMTFFHPPNYIGSLVPEGTRAAASIAEMHDNAGLATQPAADIRKEAWRKAILSAILMPVSVMTRMVMSQIMEQEELRSIVKGLLDDFLTVARCEGYEYGDDFPAEAMQYLLDAGDHKPSMLIDFEENRALEIGFLNGKLQHYAVKHGIDIPANQLLCTLIEGLIIARDAEAARNAVHD